MKPLYELAQSHAKLSEMIDKFDDDELDMESINFMMSSLEGAITEKCNSIACIVKNFENQAEGIKKIEENAYARRKRIEKNLDNLKKYMLDSMITSEINKVISAQFEINIKNNPPSVDIFSENLLPKEYYVEKVVTTVSVDKNKIKVDIKAGIEIPGVKLTQGKRLEIK